MFKNQKKIKKISAVALSATILAGALLPTASFAQETRTPTTTVNTTNSNYVVGQLTQADINLINANAKNAGYAQEIVPEQRNPATALAKKLAVKALRTSAGYVESALSKVIGKNYASKVAKSFHKIADYIEAVQNVQELGIASILIKAGLPSDVAWETARWIVLFFGL